MEHVRVTVDFVGPWLLITDRSTFRASRAPELIELGSRLADLVTREQSG
jgi:hypothetical protein